MSIIFWRAYVDDPIDFDSFSAEPLAAVRERFGIDPDGAFVRTAADPWCGSLGPPDDRENSDLLREGIQDFD